MTKWKKCACLLGAGGFAALLFWQPQAMKSGIADALWLCGQQLIPTLFPFLVLSAFFVQAGLYALTGKHIEKAMQTLFRLPGFCFGIVLFSMCGGYPVGLTMTRDLYTDGKLTAQQAKRMCLFCMNAGPAFIISGIGFGLYGQGKIGLLLYISVCLAALMLGIFLRMRDAKNADSTVGGSLVVEFSGVAALTKSVTAALQAMFQICAWILLFGGLSGCLSSFPLPSVIRFWMLGFFEVSRTILQDSNGISLPCIAALLAFGGCSVHGQVSPCLAACGVRYRTFFGARILHALLSYGWMHLLLWWFPCELPVFSPSTPVTYMPVSVSVPSAAALLALCMLFLTEVERNGKLCYNRENNRGCERPNETQKPGHFAKMRILSARKTGTGRGHHVMP